MPEAQADAAVEVAEDATNGLVSEERLQAVIYRALFIQAAVVVGTIIAIMTAILAAFT